MDQNRPHHRNMKRIHMQFPPEMLRVLAQLAAGRGTSISQLVRSMVFHCLKDLKESGDEALRNIEL